jgi:hypothetical protein
LGIIIGRSLGNSIGNIGFIRFQGDLYLLACVREAELAIFNLLRNHFAVVLADNTVFYSQLLRLAGVYLAPLELRNHSMS